MAKKKIDKEKIIEQVDTNIKESEKTELPQLELRVPPNMTPEEFIQKLNQQAVQQEPRGQENPMIMPDIFNNLRNNYYVGNKIIWVTGEIDWHVASEVIRRLNFYNDDTKEPITMYISSPGGICDGGWAIVDVMEKIISKGTPIYTVCTGLCYSMATAILASGSKGFRFAFPRSRIMIHQTCINECICGSLNDMQNCTDELNMWNDMFIKLYAKLSGKKADEIRKEMSYDHFMSANEAKKLNIVDKVDVYLS